MHTQIPKRVDQKLKHSTSLAFGGNGSVYIICTETNIANIA